MKRDKFEKMKSLLRDTYAETRAFKEGGVNVNAKAFDGKRGFELPPALRAKESYGYFEGKYPAPYNPTMPAVVDKVVFPKVRELTAALTEIFDTTSNTVRYTSGVSIDKVGADIVTKFIQKQLMENGWNDSLQSIISEALITGVSFCKRYFEDTVEDVVNNYSGFTKEQFDALKAANPDSEFTVNDKYKGEIQQEVTGIDPQTGQPVVVGYETVEVDKYDITETYTENVQGLKIHYVPQHEVYMLAHDNNLQEASYFCQRKLLYRYQIRDWFKGRKYTKLIDNAIPDSYMEELETDNDYTALQKIEGNTSSNDKERDKLFLFEQYIQMGNKMYQVFSVGLEDNILEYTEVDEIPYEAFVPIKISDSLWSMSVVDTLKGEQDSRTALLRASLQNIGEAAYGRFMAVKNQYDRKALLDARPGGVVEQKAPGMIDRFPYHPLPNGVDFIYSEIGRQADNIAGSSQGSSGVAEKLFNSSATGAAIAASIKELREKDLARNLTVTGLIPLYKALYKLCRDNINDLSFVSVNGQDVEVQPATWPKTVDIKIDIVTKQDRAVKAQNELIFNTKLDEFRQTSKTPWEWYQRTESLAKSLGIEYMLDNIAKPEDIPEPKPTPEQQVALERLKLENLKIQQDMQEVEAQRQIKMREFDLEERKATMNAVNEGRKLAIQEKQLGIKYTGDKLENQLERDKYETDTVLTTNYTSKGIKVQNVGLEN